MSLAAGSREGSGGHSEAPILSAQMHLLKKTIVTPELKVRLDHKGSNVKNEKLYSYRFKLAGARLYCVVMGLLFFIFCR